MPELAFTIFEIEKENSRLGLIAKSGLLKTRIGTALFQLFNKRKFNKGIHIFEMESGADILLIKLPFPISFLSALNRQYIERYISHIYSKRGCKNCFVPAAARRLGWFEQYSTNANSRNIVFKALLLPVLDEIYSKSGLRLDNLDTAFVNGENAVELITMVKQLEPFMRYINVASSNKGVVERELTDISTDSGISIFVSSDFKSILRNAELVINLGKVSDISRYRIRTGTLVINFSGAESPLPQGEYTIIVGLEYTFPESHCDLLGEDIQRSFCRSELTEIMMAFNAGLLNGGSYNETTAALILSIFARKCCSITGFNGRRGVLRVENVLKAIRMKH